ncbi:hypothetical protein AB6D86_08540 [Vibrio splendidus]
MKRKFSLLSLILLSCSSQAATNIQPKIDPYTYLLYGAKTESNVHIDVKTFTGNIGNYGYNPSINVSTSAADQVNKYNVTVNQIFNGIEDLKQVLHQPDGFTDDDFIDFLAHQYVPKLKLTPRSLKHGTAEVTEEDTNIDTVSCDFVGLFNSSNSKVFKTHSVPVDGAKYQSTFSCTFNALQKNDVVYDISLDYGGIVFQPHFSKETTKGYRVVFLEGDNHFSKETIPNGTVVPMVYLNYSFKDVQPEAIAAHPTGPNTHFKYFIDKASGIAEFDDLSERITIKNSVSAVIDSLSALGYTASAETVGTQNEANLIFTKRDLPSNVRAGAVWDSTLNKNVIWIDNYDELTSQHFNIGNSYQRQTPTITHEIAHVIGLPHQQEKINSITSGAAYITGDKLAPSLSANKQNIVFSYVDSQSLHSLSE